MKRKFVLYHLFATICFFCFANLFAQKALTMITGKVTDGANGRPLAGASVSVKGACPSAAVPANATLMVRYVGYGPREIKLGGVVAFRGEQTFSGLKLLQKF